MRPITVLLACQERTRLATCRRLLHGQKGIRVVGVARNGPDAIATARLHPRVLLLDLSLLRGNGIALLPILRRKSPRTRVILLTGRVAEARVLEGLAHGARGYLDQKMLRTFLPKAVRAVDAGEAWVPRKMVARIVDRLAPLASREAPRP